ncbi:Homeodomain-like [Sesbania bispinosa]|nr:Homeodomain-like [Sesbania bispinosa]
MKSVPQFCTQMGVENKTHHGEEGDAVEKKKRVGFADKEDKLLIQSWLNISKDVVVRVDQKSDGFWLRITNTYNEHRCSLEERKEGQLKSRWQKLNAIVQKFSGCYKQACNVKQSGSSETDIMATAYEIYMKDEERLQKGREKEKIGECSYENANTFDMEGAFKVRTNVIDKLARIKEEELTTKEMEVVLKDTIGMTGTQLG